MLRTSRRRFLRDSAALAATKVFISSIIKSAHAGTFLGKGAGGGGNWILANGIWNDAGVWADSAVWKDAP